MKKSVHKNFAKQTGKPCARVSFLIKLQASTLQLGIQGKWDPGRRPSTWAPSPGIWDPGYTGRIRDLGPFYLGFPFGDPMISHRRREYKLR